MLSSSATSGWRIGWEAPAGRWPADLAPRFERESVRPPGTVSEAALKDTTVEGSRWDMSDRHAASCSSSGQLAGPDGPQRAHFSDQRLSGEIASLNSCPWLVSA